MASDAVIDDLPVGPDGAGDRGAGHGHVLDDLVAGFAARPLIIGQRHDADMALRDKPGFGGFIPGGVDAGHALDVSVRCADDKEAQRGFSGQLA